MIKLASAFFILSAIVSLAIVVPAERIIDWSRSHARGSGIIARTNIINVKNAPYNAAGNGSTDDTTAINSAITAAVSNDVVYFPTGYYRVTATISINKSITLRGDHPAASVIKYTPSTGNDILATSHSRSYGTPNVITSGTTQGTTNITLTSAAGFSVGDFVLVYGSNQPAFMRPVGEDGLCTWCGDDDTNYVAKQCTRIIAKSGNVVTIDDPLYINLGVIPQMKTVSMLEAVGFENLGIWRTNASSTLGYNLFATSLANSWVTNVWSTNAAQGSFYFQFCDNFTVRKCLAYDATGYGSDRAYHFYGKFWNSCGLFEDCIAFKGRHSFVLEGGGSGMVFGYNYSNKGGQNAEDVLFQGEDYDTHGAHPFMNLFEGNDGPEMDNDNTWGSSSHNVWFRNWVQNFSQSSFTHSRAAVDCMTNNWSNSWVCVVIGRTNDTGVKVAPLNHDMYDGTSKWALRLGYQGVSDAAGNVSFDAGISNSGHFHFVYDYYSNTKITTAGYDTTGITNSLYLGSSKPGWLYNRPWPIFGPDTPNGTNVNPARYRFENAMADPPADGGAQGGGDTNLVTTGRANKKAAAAF